MIQLQALLGILQAQALITPDSHKQMAKVDSCLLAFKQLMWWKMGA